MKKAYFIVLSLILFYSLDSHGYSGYRGAKWWKDAGVVKELNLTTDQVSLIEEIFNSNIGQLTDLNSKLRQKQADFRSKIEDPDSSRDEVMKLNDEVVQLKTDLKRLRLDMLLKIRDVLTPEQRQDLKQIRFKEIKKRSK